MVNVWVYYSMNLTSWGEYDSALKTLAESSGGSLDGSGTDFDLNERDLSFAFSTEAEARAFVARVNGWPSRNFRTEVRLSV